MLGASGIRVGEARDLRWCDLRTQYSDDGSRLVADVSGKTGHREAVFQPGGDACFKRLYDLRTGELGVSPKLTEHVFVHPDGTQIKSMKRSFYSLLDFAGVPRERHGKPRTMYSLRHFYATQRLSNEVSPFLLATQMGTSVEMLEKHYGHVVTSSLAKQLTKGPQSAAEDSEKRYPFS